MRQRILFNDAWHFHKGDIPYEFPKWKGPTYSQAKTERFLMGPASREYNSYPDDYRGHGNFVSEKWEHVRLPHDYVVWGDVREEENNALGFFKYENAWYRKIFRLEQEDEDKRLILEFEGVASNATVYFNGCLLKHNFGAYNSFEVDITDFARFDEENVLAVYVDAQAHEGWWYAGAGICRDVYLLKTDRVAIDKYGIWARSQQNADGAWRVLVENTLVSAASGSETLTVTTDLLDAAGRVISSASADASLPSYGRTCASVVLDAADPHLWDIDSPYLYTVRTTVESESGMRDAESVRIGFRTFSVDPARGFFLNGRHVKIKGVCAHEDCGLLGRAVPANVHRYKTKMIKEMGANAYRTSHYQQDSAILDSMDEEGLIVLDEARWFSSSEESVSQLETLIKRDRNRPSVFFWSLGNEEPFFSKPWGKRITKTLTETVKRLDDTRIITCAVDRPANAPVFDELDVIGINYNLDVFDETHALYPECALLSTENCATGNTRAWYGGDCPQKGYLSAYDKDTNAWFRGREYTWKFIMERDFVMGGYQWDAFEHRGEAVWPRLCSQSGAIDLYLQKKDAFYQNQSHWSDTPMIHLLPHWNLDLPTGTPVEVWAYTNCEEAELFIGGESQGKQTVLPYTHLVWSVPYTPGKIEVKGYVGGKLAAIDSAETTGAPVRLSLRLENEVRTANDVAILTCTALDSEGQVVPDASPTVEFFTNDFGRILSTGSDVSDHTPLGSLCRKMRAGAISVAAGVALNRGVPVGERGKITVYARAEGLCGAMLEIEIGNLDA
ncbi:MAG: DUF4982 domain-containing protein [Clostridia bacterium]|nr:DUF4982 domain-containing protein [Clostridia bacterium]